MLSIGSLSSASGAADYYIKGGEGQIAGYFTAYQEASRWGGSAKEHFGLDKESPVDFKIFEALWDGQVSETQTLGRMVKGERLRDPGRDFTFSAPKSVSLAAIGILEKPIIEAFARSVATAMEYYETNLAQAKVWDKEKGRQVKVGNQKILYATFMDFVSRSNDANLHIHTPTANIAIGEDGKIRSLNFDLAYKHKILLGNIQRAALAKDMKALGLSVRSAGKNGLWELEGSTTEILMQFSKRRQQMLSVAPHKAQDAKAMAHIAKITRPNKTNVAPEVQKAKWKQELKGLGTSIAAYTQSLLDAPKKDQRGLTAEDAITYAVSHMSETEQHFDRHVLLRHAMVSAYGNVDIKSMEAELQDRVEKGQLLISEDGRWLKPMKTHKLEARLLSELDKGHLKAKVLTSREHRSEHQRFEGFTAGQEKAADLILTDLHRMVGVEGVAGTGKTYLLEKTLPILSEKGYQLIGLAPTLKAARGLEETGVFDKVMTVQKFHKNPMGNSKTVLVMDEAGMVGSEKMHSVLHFANIKNMPRVVLMGDTQQLPPIEAGRPFEHLINNGLRTAQMDDVVRQKSARHRKGVVELSKQDLRAAFQTLKKEIHEVPKDQHVNYALQLRSQMQNPSIIVNTNAQRQAINTSISAQIESQPGSSAGMKQKIWNSVYMTKTERTRVASYEGATHIRFTRDVGRDFKRGDTYRITGIDHDAARLYLKGKDGSKSYVPARHGSGESFTQIYKQSEIRLHEGDAVKFKHTDKKLGITNNDYGKIVSLTNQNVTISLDDKATLSLPRGHRMLGHLDHAWANTTYSFQGVTVEDNIAIMGADNNPLNTLEALYVGASRHKENLVIVTDDKDRLLRTITEKLELSEERIEFREPPSKDSSGMKVISAKDVIERDTSSTKTEQEKTTPTTDRNRGDRGR